MASNPAIYAWLTEQFPGVKIKRIYYRDLSSGVMAVKILHRFHEDLVQLDIYSPAANSFENKKENWKLLNDRVLTKLSMGLTKKQIIEIAKINHETIDAFLLELKTNVELWEKDPESAYTCRIVTNRKQNKKPGTVISAATSASTQNKLDEKKIEKNARASTNGESFSAVSKVEAESANNNANNISEDAGLVTHDSFEELNAFVTNEEEIKKWLGTMPTLAQMNEKQMDKDFANGILFAKLASYLKPQEFEETQYGNANWEILIARVFPAFGISLEPEEIRDLKDAKPLAIQKVLLQLKKMTPGEENATKTASTDAIQEADRNGNFDAKICRL